MGIGDAAASLVGPKIYDEFVRPYEKRLVDGVHNSAQGCGCISAGTHGKLWKVWKARCGMIDLDYPCPVSLARDKMGPKQVICGNINPVSVLRDASPEEIYKAVETCHKEAGENFIVGAGCEVPRDTQVDNLMALARYASSH